MYYYGHKYEVIEEADDESVSFLLESQWWFTAVITFTAVKYLNTSGTVYTTCGIQRPLTLLYKCLRIRLD